ncbi:zinc-binding dehydrogenase [Micromonospora haikouensis]|uniref:zinc-binding dehydrogenase n=1 Tax=Micromonospora haikouensis TaxID=686309 RepID=UPI003D753787
MRVVEVARFGGPEVLTLTEAPDPSPGPGEVVVETAYANVLWIDTAIRAGRAGQWFPVRPPYRPGSGVSGTVSAVGGRVTPLVGQAFPLDRAADAHRAVEDRAAVGKTLLTP